MAPETKPGILVGIDSPYYKNAFPESAVIYSLNPIREPNEGNLDVAAMRMYRVLS